MTPEVFLALLLAVSILTSLTVEAIKKFVGDKYNASSNIVAGVVSIVLGVIVGVVYCLVTGVAFSTQIIIVIVALVFFSWLCSMIGYDKVVQAITQIKMKN